MSRNKSPAFQFYPSDYLSDERVQMMNLEEEGAYIRALCYCWNEGSIPNDSEKLLKLLGKGGSATVARVVQACFQVSKKDSTRMIHLRLEKERVKQKEWKRKSREGGKRSAEKRAEIAKKSIHSTSKGGSTGAVQPNGNSSSSSSSTSSIDIYTSKGLHPSPKAPKNLKRKKEQLSECGEGSNVFLTDSERKILLEEWGQEELRFLITALADYSTTDEGRFMKFKDHYRVLLKWRKGNHSDGKGFYRHPKTGWGYYKHYEVERYESAN